MLYFYNIIIKIRLNYLSLIINECVMNRKDVVADLALVWCLKALLPMAAVAVGAAEAPV